MTVSNIRYLHVIISSYYSVLPVFIVIISVAAGHEYYALDNAL